MRIRVAATAVAATLVAACASLANPAGVEVTAGDEGELADLLVAAAGTLGGLVALYGRISARRRVR